MTGPGGSSYPSASHWGAFSVRVEQGRAVEVLAHRDDPDPSPLLGNIAGAAHHRSRVAGPAIRRGWLESGPGPTSARGREPFVEVEWDEALDRVAAEVDRVRREHGNEAIFGGSYGWSSAGRFHHAQSQVHRFLNSVGGYTRSVGNYSHGASLVLLPHVLGDVEPVLRTGSSWPSLVEHTELLVAFGGVPIKNAAVSPGGFTIHTARASFEAALRRGMCVASISPQRDDVTGAPDESWYPIIPGTDTAMMLGLAHTLVVNGLVDRQFVQRYCVGYEALETYLLGGVDGVTKDAAWASAICDVPADRIRALAGQMASSRTMLTVTWSLQRTEHGEQPVWAAIALAAMLGQIGLPGCGFGHGYGSMADLGSTAPLMTRPTLPQGRNSVSAFIPVARIADMLLAPGEAFEFNGGAYTYPDIRLLYWAGGNPFHHHQDLNRLRTAIGRPETVVVHEPYWTASARHADIVLPATIPLERNDIGGGRRDSHLIAMHRALAPYGQARDDFEILRGLADRLGVAQVFDEGRSEWQWLEHLYEQWRTKLGTVGAGLPPFDEFWVKGDVALPPPDYDGTLLAEFRADPVASPLRTPSGRIELYSATIAEFGYADCPAHPAWLEPAEWLGAPLARRFPLHLISNQPATRLHSQLDVGAVSAASKIHDREPIRLHPADAAARGIANGDVVRVFNDRGACLAGARVSTHLRRGVVQLATGAWFDPADHSGGDTAGDTPRVGLCRHGNPNVLTADRGTSRLAQASTGQHCLVEVERYTGPVPDMRAFDGPTFVAASPESDATDSDATDSDVTDREHP